MTPPESGEVSALERMNAQHLAAMGLSPEHLGRVIPRARHWWASKRGCEPCVEQRHARCVAMAGDPGEEPLECRCFSAMPADHQEEFKGSATQDV